MATMASVNGDYPHPVQVNGFQCRNCTDVGYAKKHIDPAHPKSGPYDVTAATDPSRQAQLRAAPRFSGRAPARSSISRFSPPRLAGKLGEGD